MHTSKKMVACTFFRIRGIRRSIQSQELDFRVMEDAQRVFNHETKSKGQNISVGSDETKSNGHRRRVEPIESMRSIDNGSA
jgi:hypothetical protein